MSEPKEMNIKSTIRVFDNVNELDSVSRELIEKARAASMKAYAPYSKFHVGAALLMKNGQFITGNNQENAAYPSGLCAERTALFYASSQFPNEPVEAIAVTCFAEGKEFHEPVSPCGACRQVIAEYESRTGNPIKLIMAGTSGKVYVSESMENLLPLMFSRDYLK